jgi:hypothetical protein
MVLNNMTTLEKKDYLTKLAKWSIFQSLTERRIIRVNL